MLTPKRRKYEREQNGDAIRRRLWLRANKFLRSWRLAGVDEETLSVLEEELELRAKRVYTRLTDRHPDRI